MTLFFRGLVFSGLLLEIRDKDGFLRSLVLVFFGRVENIGNRACLDPLDSTRGETIRIRLECLLLGGSHENIRSFRLVLDDFLGLLVVFFPNYAMRSLFPLAYFAKLILRRPDTGVFFEILALFE